MIPKYTYKSASGLFRGIILYYIEKLRICQWGERGGGEAYKSWQLPVVSLYMEEGKHVWASHKPLYVLCYAVCLCPLTRTSARAEEKRND